MNLHEQVQAARQALKYDEPVEPDVWLEIERFRVCALPPDDPFIPDWHAWSLTIETRGKDTWAVCHFEHECLSVRRGTTKATDFPGGYGRWDWEASSSYRSETWIRNHRFSLDDAMRAAQYWAPHVIVNGFTPADVLRHGAERRAKAAESTTTTTTPS